jgi:hypothetical protein
MELLTSIAVLGVMMAMLFSVFNQINNAWLQGDSRVETFTTARATLDYMSRELSQAIATNIAFYGDATHIYFVAPVNTGSTNLADLCEVGYELQVKDPNNPQKLTLEILRRLVAPTAQNCQGFPGSTWNPYAASWWSTTFFNKPVNPLTESTTALASNCVVGLQFQYYGPNGNLLSVPYIVPTSGNRLPSLISITMSNVDSRTATKLNLVGPIPPQPPTAWQTITNSTLRVFSTTVYLSNISP